MSFADLRGRGNAELVQQESFTTCISNNVKEYGSGIICMQEQLANADDAKGKHFIVCLDKSQHADKSLLAESMGKLQGPSLLIGSDAEFSEEDLRNYTLKVGNSCKADDPKTTGKFGKGALTAYSVADVIHKTRSFRQCHVTLWLPYAMQRVLPQCFLPVVISDMIHFNAAPADS